ncbi:MAG: helix-turn-helix transcriptional regulator [Clostridiales bacterium]|jgi:transcriptional regulator with XRE-family HTH domain|nr:helix-turn-helix transcriptional regulator [Clostridiales bacterium]
MDYNKLIGSNIRFERQKRDLTIEELSEILNIAPGFLGLIERGQRGTSIKNLCKIAEFFSISLDQLITRPAGTVVKSEDELMAEKIENIELRDKYTTAVSLIHGLSTVELDFVITSIKSMRRLMKKAEYVDFEAGEQ